MALVGFLLKLALGLVWIDGLLEMALCESCLWWIQEGASGPYEIENPAGGTFLMNSEPQHLLVAPTQAAAAAGAFAWTVVGFGGVLSLVLRGSRFRDRAWASAWWRYWPFMSIFFALYTLAVGIAVNVLVDMHDGQTIDTAVASTLGPDVNYPLDSWPLPNFYTAVLDLMLMKDTPEERATAQAIFAHRNTMLSWRWNIVPLIVIQVAVCILAWFERREWAARPSASTSTVSKGDVEAPTEKAS